MIFHSANVSRFAFTWFNHRRNVFLYLSRFCVLEPSKEAQMCCGFSYFAEKQRNIFYVGTYLHIIKIILVFSFTLNTYCFWLFTFASDDYLDDEQQNRCENRKMIFTKNYICSIYLYLNLLFAFFVESQSTTKAGLTAFVQKCFERR